MDADVRRLVLERPEGHPETVVAAVMHGYRRARVADETYPVAIPDPGSSVDGLVVYDLMPREIARVRFFEGFEFTLAERAVRIAGRLSTALVCIATERMVVEDEPWHVDEWRARHKAAFLKHTEIFMREFDRMDPEEAETVWREAKLFSAA